MKNKLFHLFMLAMFFQTSLLLALQADFKTITEFQKNNKTSQWFAWKVDLIQDHGILCCSYNNIGLSISGSSICIHEDNRSNSFQMKTNGVDADSELVVYYKMAEGRVQNIRAVSNSCNVNIADNEIIWLESTTGESSIAFMLEQADDFEKDAIKRNLIQAMSFHKDISATSALKKLHQMYDKQHQQHIELMLSSMRGEKGLDFVIQQFNSQINHKIREHTLFSISQSPLKKAQQKLMKIAREDSSAGLRENATFWLSQMEIENAADLIMQLISEERNSKVRLHGVFALSQVSNGDGLPYLEKLIRYSKDNKVRQQALFWLAESDEDRAMPILDSILDG